MATWEHDSDRAAMSETTHREERARRMLAECLCTLCPPNRGENATRRPRHGAQKPKQRRRRERP